MEEARGCALSVGVEGCFVDLLFGVYHLMKARVFKVGFRNGTANYSAEKLDYLGEEGDKRYYWDSYYIKNWQGEWYTPVIVAVSNFVAHEHGHQTMDLPKEISAAVVAKLLKGGE